MPAPRLSFRAGRSSILLDEAGTVVSAVPDARPGESYLDRSGEIVVQLDSGCVAWAATELAVDADEVEVSHRSPRLTATVRHSFGARWGVRLALANRTDERLSLAAVSLGWEPAYGWPAWALAAGAVGSYVVDPPDGRGPLLGGVLGLGTLASVTPAGLQLGPVVLEPGGRYAVSWVWDWYANPRAFAARPGGQPGDRQVPRSLSLTLGDSALISAGEDEALILPGPVATDPLDDQVELITWEPGRHPVELRSARGVTRYDVSWAEPVERWLVSVAAEVLSGPRTPAGIVRLTGIEAALVVQLALRIDRDDADAAEEALDLFTARLTEAGGTDPRTAAFLCGEFDRTGDSGLLVAATGVVLAATAAVPGLGLAAAEVGLARVLSGLGNADLSAHLTSLTGRLPPPGSGSFARQTAALELAMLTSQPGPRTDVTDRLTALGSWFGGGLKGVAVRPRPVAEAAHLAAVLAGLDEQTSVGLRTRWACTAHELGRWTEAAVITELGEHPHRGRDAGPAHGWLAIAARTR